MSSCLNYTLAQCCGSFLWGTVVRVSVVDSKSLWIYSAKRRAWVFNYLPIEKSSIPLLDQSSASETMRLWIMEEMVGMNHGIDDYLDDGKSFTPPINNQSQLWQPCNRNRLTWKRLERPYFRSSCPRRARRFHSPLQFFSGMVMALVGMILNLLYYVQYDGRFNQGLGVFLL